MSKEIRTLEDIFADPDFEKLCGTATTDDKKEDDNKDK